MSVRVRFAPGSTRDRLSGPLLTMGFASNRPEQATNEVRSASKDETIAPWSVYILECCDRSFYIGATTNVERRVIEHNAGYRSKYTAAHRPVWLVYSELHEDRASALRREAQLKRWTRAKKLALIANSLSKLRQLSQSRDW